MAKKLTIKPIKHQRKLHRTSQADYLQILDTQVKSKTRAGCQYCHKTLKKRINSKKERRKKFECGLIFDLNGHYVCKHRGVIQINSYVYRY